MSQRLGKIFSEIPSGIQPSLPMDKKVLWEEASNVIFQEDSVQPAPSQSVIFRPLETAPAIGAIESLLSGVPNAFWGTPAKLYRGIYGTQTPTDVTRASGGDYTGIRNATLSEAATMWSFVRFGTWILATNGKDRPQIWKLSAPTNFVKWEEVAGSGNDLGNPSTPITTAQIVRTIGPYVLLFNTVNGSEVYEWCDTNNPHVFNPATTNAAGQSFLRDLGSGIMAAEALGRGLGVYGSGQLHLVEFIGAPFIFGDQHLITGVGAVSKSSVTAVDRLHYGMSDKGLFVTDGTQVRWIDDPSIHDYIYEDLNFDQISKVCVWYDSAYKMVMVSFPRLGSLDNNRTVGFYVPTGAYSVHDFGRSAVTDAGIFKAALMFDELGNGWLLGPQGAPPAGSGSPLTLVASSGFTVGWGSSGWGSGGWGGNTIVVG